MQVTYVNTRSCHAAQDESPSCCACTLLHVPRLQAQDRLCDTRKMQKTGLGRAHGVLELHCGSVIAKPVRACTKMQGAEQAVTSVKSTAIQRISFSTKSQWDIGRAGSLKGSMVASRSTSRRCAI